MITPEMLAKAGTEDAEQMALFCWANQNLARFPCLEWMHAIPNGGKRDIRTAAKLKATGVKAGVADIFLPWPVDHHHGLYIELKRADGVQSDVKPNQKEFAEYCFGNDYCWRVCFGWKQATNTIEQYLAGELPC